MASHPPAPRTELEEEIDPRVGGEDQENQTSDDRLANNLYKDYSSQNQAFIQIFLALTAGGVGYGVEVRDAYAFFAKEKIDAEKLIKDPVYRAQIKKHLGHLNTWEKKAIENKTSKLGVVINEANRAVKEVDETSKKLTAFKEEHLKDYVSELQNLYGLDKGEIDAIIQRAKYAIQKDPSLSVQDLVQTEAQSMARDKIKSEVENNAKTNREKLSKEEKNKRIQALTEEKKNVFYENQNIQTINHHETQFQDSLISNCKHHLGGILVTPPPAAPPQQVNIAPQGIPAAPPISPSPPIPAPTPTSAWPIISSVPIPGGLSLRNVPIPTLGGFKTGLNILGGGFGKLLGGMGKFIGRRGLGRFINLAANLGKRAINRALDAFMPGLGMTVGKINDVIKSITGIDVEKTILVGAALLVGAVASVAIILPLIIGIGVFSYITGSNPLKLSYSNEKTIGWSEFNKRYLTVNNGALPLDFSPLARNDKEITWQEFEKENLTPSQRYLSLESIAK